MNAFGITTIITTSLVNLSHIIWTIWLSIEQVKTGWGYGTNIELGVLYPWLCEILCAPFLILTFSFLIASIIKKPKKWVLNTNIILFLTAIFQFAITNLFIWF